MHGLPDLAPRPAELEPIERASRDAIAALQLRRLRWSLRHAFDHVPHYRTAFAAAGAHPDDLRGLEDSGEVPLHHQGRSAGELPVRPVRRAARADRPYPRLLRHHGQADRGGIHAQRSRRVGTDGGALAARRRGAAGHAAAQRLWLRAVHRRAGAARRRHADGDGGDPGVRRHDRAAGAADPGFRAGDHRGDAELHAGDPRRLPRRRRRSSRDRPAGGHVRRRALDQRHAPGDRALLRHACDRRSTGCPR